MKDNSKANNVHQLFPRSHPTNIMNSRRNWDEYCRQHYPNWHNPHGNVLSKGIVNSFNLIKEKLKKKA